MGSTAKRYSSAQVLLWAIGVSATAGLLGLGAYELSQATVGTRSATETAGGATGGNGAGTSDASSAKDLMQTNCIVCHGPDLKGGLPGVRTPSLVNPDFLSVASDRYLRTLITKGRTGTPMPAWGPVLGAKKIDSIVAYIRSFEPKGPKLEEVLATKGSAHFGAALYRGNCATCHGKHGQGGLGTALAAPEFLRLVSNPQLVRTMLTGRPNTGMPSWKKLGAQEIADIVAFIRSWQGPGANLDEVQARLRSGEASRRIGKRLFRANCADCHGKKGEGAIGPSLNSPSFLGIASNHYLAKAIRDGRPGTAMPSWRDLSAEDIADIVSHLRTLSPGTRFTTATVPFAVKEGTAPDANNGKALFDMACASCHGKEAVGGSAPQLANSVFLDSASDAFLATTISYGRAGTAMRGFLRHSKGVRGAAGVVDMRPREILDVIAYVRTLQGKLIDPGLERAVLGSSHRGESIYHGTGGCASCHGTYGEGGVGPALGNSMILSQLNEGFVLGTLVMGRSGTEMRKFGSGGITHLSPEDMMDVSAYLRTLPGKKPIGDAGWRHFAAAGPLSSGALLYRQNCSACHGENGKEGYAPQLNNPEFLAASSDGYLVATIARGRQNTPMRSFGPGGPGMAVLTPNEIRNIVAHIRSWQAKPGQ